MKARALGILLFPMVLAACGSTIVRSGLPPGRIAPGFDEHWHAAFVFGAIPFQNSYDLAAICPEGWSELHMAADEFTFLAGIATAFIYSPSRLTVICAAIGDPAPPPLGAYPPPTPHTSGQEPRRR